MHEKMSLFENRKQEENIHRKELGALKSLKIDKVIHQIDAIEKQKKAEFLERQA